MQPRKQLHLKSEGFSRLIVDEPDQGLRLLLRDSQLVGRSGLTGQLCTVIVVPVLCMNVKNLLSDGTRCKIRGALGSRSLNISITSSNGIRPTMSVLVLRLVLIVRMKTGR